MSWSIEQVSDTTARMRIDYDRRQSWEFWVLLSADRHIDHKLSDLKMQRRHLEQAKAGGWPIIDIGDLFCAMQGRFDPRSTRTALLECLNEQEEYADALVDYAENVFGPYAANFALLGLGNHETGMLRRNETHLLQRLVKRLKAQGSPAILGGVQWMDQDFARRRRAGATVHQYQIHPRCRRCSSSNQGHD